MKKILVVWLALILGLLCAVSAAGAEVPGNIAVGDIITFGTYPQTEKGDDRTPIEWIVLDVQDGKALLISKYGLGAPCYHWKLQDITWEDCTLRAWLNNEFLRKAFSAEEQAAILMTMVDNSKSQGYSGWNTDGGSNTMDKVFLLSYAEANHYFGVELWKVTGSDQNIAARVAPTEYAIKIGALANSEYQTADGKAAGWWWLRSPGAYQNNAVIVYAGGEFGCDIVNKSIEVVRPAMWVNLDAEPFRSDGPASGLVPQADAEPFVFRNGITWGMTREEVVAAEGSDGDYSEGACLFLRYDEVKISKYSGMLAYIFSEDALRAGVYLISDAKQDTFDYMLKAYDTRYGEGREADFQDLFSIVLRIIPDSNAPENPQDCMIRKWKTGNGTEIWMIWGDYPYNELMIFYVSPDLLNPQEEEIDMTGI